MVVRLLKKNEIVENLAESYDFDEHEKEKICSRKGRKQVCQDHYQAH